jgi:hypothetical protein
MSDQVVFDGVVLWDLDENGISARLVPGIARSLGTGPIPGVVLPGFVVSKSRIGVGVWLKPGGVDEAQHRLELVYRTNDKPAIRGLIALAGGRVGSLAIPSEGTLANCALTGTSEIVPTRIDGGYALEVSLTFTQYPN